MEYVAREKLGEMQESIAVRYLANYGPIFQELVLGGGSKT